MSIPSKTVTGLSRELCTDLTLIYQEDVAETIIVTRTQRIHTPYNEKVSYFCHLSKNLWNQAHRIISGYYKKYRHVPSYEDLDSILNKKSYYKNPDFDNYHKLGPATSQQILKVYIEAWMDYFKSKKGYFENPKDYTGEPKEPGYKKKDGEFILIFTNQQINFREKKDGSVYMTFPKKVDKKPSKLKNLKILLGNTNDTSDSYVINRLMNGKFNIVRIVPKGTGYWIEIVYDQEVLANASEVYNLDRDIITSVDLGVENLGAIVDNIGNRPIVIKCKELKSANQ